ncbi:glycosyl transferase family 2 [Pseudomonas oryzihabitans]|nr:glycosyl transferase family 2 [Pseudomonas psychrotolerans]
MSLSIVIPLYNEARHIERTLMAVAQAASRAKLQPEILVVDNGSSDSGPALAQALGAQVLDGRGLTIAGVRNLGARQARHAELAFLDADIEVPPDWLLIWQRERAAGADAFTLDCLAPSVAPWYARAWQRRSLGSARRRWRAWLPTPALCLSRAWFERVGGFDEQLNTGEDKDLGLRLHTLGAKQLAIPEPVVWHWGYEASWREWLGKELWRQSGHLAGQRASLGLWRFSLLCLFAAGCSLLALIGLLLGSPLALAGGLSGVLLLPLALALRQTLRQGQLLLVLQLWLLHGIRLHLGAAAALLQLFNLRIGRPRRG